MRLYIILFTLSTLTVSCTSSSSQEEPIKSNPEMVDQVVQKKVISEDLNAEDFYNKMTTSEADELIVLDVRTADEFARGHLKNAVNIDFYSTDFSEQLDALSKSASIYVYCMAGGRSGKTKKMLAEKGFTKVYNLLGGYGNWPYKNQ